MSFWRRREERDDVGHHPRGADFGGDPVKDLGSITQDDQNEVIWRHLHDVKAAKSLDGSGLRYDLVLDANEEIRAGHRTEVQVIDDRCGHTRHTRSLAALASW
jgi:hypothetical protein